MDQSLNCFYEEFCLLYFTVILAPEIKYSVHIFLSGCDLPFQVIGCLSYRIVLLCLIFSEIENMIIHVQVGSNHSLPLINYVPTVKVV